MPHFCQSIRPTPLIFTSKELSETTLFHTTAGSAINKIFTFVDEIALAFEKVGFTVSKQFPGSRWKGEFAFYIKCGVKHGSNNQVLYLGVWCDFWKAHGAPLCIGVHATWAPAIVERFKKMFPDYGMYDGYLTSHIDEQLLLVHNHATFLGMTRCASPAEP